MPSPDETFFNIRRMHLVFAVSSAALLAATVWMLAADHYREWKVCQRTYRETVEPWLASARIAESEADGFLARRQELAEALATARSAVPDRALVERFGRTVEQDAAARGTSPCDMSGVAAAYEALAARPDAQARETLLNRLRGFMDAARLRQANLEREVRFRRADLDEARSAFEIAVGEARPETEVQSLQLRVDRIQEQIAVLSKDLDRAAAVATALGGILSEITRPEDDAHRALAGHEAELDRLRPALARQQPGAGRRILDQPLIDALARPLAIEQIWLPDLTIDYNFCRVARFDRCATCHQGIARTEAGSAGRPAVPRQQAISLQLPRPGTNEGRAGQGGAAGPSLQGAYGFSLAPRGILESGAPTVLLVLPRTPAAEADLRAGDVIEKIDGHGVAAVAEVDEILLGALDAGGQPAGSDKGKPARPFSLEVRRGLAHPYSTHPRLDLFVGAQSPHPAETFGCTICHDGQGSATEFKRASHSPNAPEQKAAWKAQHGWFRNEHWDYPMLPARFAESRCLKCHHAVTDLNPTDRFPDPPAPKLMAGYHLVRQYGCFGCHEIKGVDAAGRTVGPDMRLGRGDASNLPPSGPSGASQEPGGSSFSFPMPKVGPSLRNLTAKTYRAYVADRIADPGRFLPSSRMPQFFGLHGHLEGNALADAKRFEAVEILAATEYLMTSGAGPAPLRAPAGVTERPSPERGKRLFQLQGCLACHKHADFPAGQGVQGPDLSRVGAKYADAGAPWVVSWLRDPTHYSPQTLMPNPLLEPVPLPGPPAEKSKDGEPARPRVTDPAADIAAYLVAETDFQPAGLPGLVERDLDELAVLYLSKKYSRAAAEQYVREGIAPGQAGPAQGDAAELSAPITREKKLRYVGRRTVERRGCFGCHDIPGMEQAQAIGPALSDWGRKQESLLAFEQVHRFLEVSGAGEQGAGFYLDAVRGKRREGFIWQKLREPRSFDYKKAHNKPYTDWLLMGRFNLTPQEREQVITFVLGLVADPPAEKYVHQPAPRRRAIIHGQKVLDKFACAECHTLQMERWTVQYAPGTLQAPKAAPDFDFLQPRIAPAQIAASKAEDRRGKCRVEVSGMPRLDAEGKPVVVEGDEEDAEGEPLPMLSFVPWEPAAVAGQLWPAGGADLLVYEHQVQARRPPVGGTLARLLYPVVLAEARAAGVTVAGMEPWGWLPPPLVREWMKVQPAWLHQYLLNPTVVRPASVLRMPRYNLSPEDAAALVNYFAAVDGAEFPYASGAPDRAQAAAPGTGDRLDDAFRILTDRKTFCAKCHRIGDYSPGEEVRSTLGPDLQQAGSRLRPDYVHRWLANPKALLPYTGMPVNFPPDKAPLGQDLFPGTAREQLDAVTRLIQEYEQYMLRRQSMRAVIEGQGK